VTYKRTLVPVLLVSLALGCSAPSVPPDDFGPIPAFTLTERGGSTVGLNDLAGKTWVAAFVFTRCAGPCTQISGAMARLQHDLADLPDARLVSFTVDPEFDTPEVLTKYADKYLADPKRWLFLTGQQASVYKLLREGFKVGVEPAPEKERRPGEEVMHSTKLVVIDKHGHNRGYFDGVSPDGPEQVAKLVRVLAREKP
jgi:protein SCO1